ncbi:MAG: aminotransferase class III-fold pyridoxal phosphate-dependent enzyme [Oscillibacter sp.]|nr:aminotransferase class III-fold pyridoxal phosphate-dependent enzyme [Oscillibacter sp.]
MNTEKNKLIWEDAKQYMPGGACAGGRSNRIFGMPLYLDHAEGCKLYSVDGNEYIDYHCGAGAALYGHNHPRLKAALEEVISKGFYMNHDSEWTLEFAKKFTSMVPGVEKIRLTNSGSEATMAALRLARGYTGRKMIIKMDGHFHGMHEMIWYNHGAFPEVDANGEVVKTVPDSGGIPDELGQFVKVIRYNDIDALNAAVEKYKDQIAAVIMEPISFNCGCFAGIKEYLQQVREVCTQNGIVLIFDEVICGMRFRPGSAQGYYGVNPDLSTFAKAIGGGIPIALVGGKAEIMDTFNPNGPVVCSGTTSGTQMAVRVGLECLNMASEPWFFDQIEKTADALYGGMNDLFKKHGIPGHVRGLGARFAIYFGCEDPETDFHLRETMKTYDVAMSKKFIAGALEHGLYFHYYGDAPYPAHCGFGIQHTMEDIAVSLERMDDVFKTLK